LRRNNRFEALFSDAKAQAILLPLLWSSQIFLRRLRRLVPKSAVVRFPGL
jgi:hypothetical protein